MVTTVLMSADTPIFVEDPSFFNAIGMFTKDYCYPVIPGNIYHIQQVQNEMLLVTFVLFCLVKLKERFFSNMFHIQQVQNETLLVTYVLNICQFRLEDYFKRVP